ncbi:polyketide cyclase [bacterium]|nr:polyketide cyclase [bacterium]
MEDISQRSLKITRKYQASAELLWKVLTTPEYIKEWWGPDGFTNSIRLMDVREGGKWEFTMRGPDGTEFENEYVYQTIVPLKKIVLEHLKNPKFTIIITIEDIGNATRVEWCNVFDSVPTKEEAVRAFKADIGLEQNLEKLGKFLKSQF